MKWAKGQSMFNTKLYRTPWFEQHEPH